MLTVSGSDRAGDRDQAEGCYDCKGDTVIVCCHGIDDSTPLTGYAYFRGNLHRVPVREVFGRRVRKFSPVSLIAA